MNTRAHTRRPGGLRAVLLVAALVGLQACGDDEDTKSPSGWSGILSAMVDGVSTQFTDRIRVEEISGNDLWVIADGGDTQLQFYLPTTAPGTYNTENQGMGRYVPNTDLPDFDYNDPAGALFTQPGVGGTITIDVATASRISGSFSFQVATEGMGSTMSVTDGVFDLRFGSLGESSSPVGVWQNTEAGVQQQTFELRADGSLDWITASYEAEFCMAQSGTWSEDGDSLRITLDGSTGAAAWARVGTGLAIWSAENPDPMIFEAAAGLPDCADYGFGGSSTGWTGILTALVDGALVDFSSELWIEEIAGGDAWVIGNAGDRQLQFYVSSAAPGVYAANPTSFDGMGRYVPDTDVPNYDYANPVGEYNTNFPGGNGSITVTTANADAFAGTFAFQVFNAAGQDFTITSGVVAITRVVNPTPAGIWHTGENGLYEDTIELAEGGDFSRVTADWDAGDCSSATNQWSHDATRIFLGTGLNRSLFAHWSITDGVLSLDFGGGVVRQYTAVASLPDCDDYTFDPLQFLMRAWKHGNSNFEDNIEFRVDGGFPITVALFADDYCFELDASWLVDGDSLRITYHDGFGPEAYAWARSGSNLLLSAPGQGTMVYTPQDALPGCADYNFEMGIPVGIWQQTAPAVFEYTLEFAANGDFGRTYAHFEQDWCFDETGTWTATADTLYLHYSDATELLAYERYGVSLRITFSDGNWTTLYMVDDMPTCADYGMGGSAQAPDPARKPLSNAAPLSPARSTSAFREH